MDGLTLLPPSESSFLTRNTIVERVDAKKLDALLASDFLLLEWTNRACWFVNELRRAFQNEKKQISLYAAAFDPRADGVVVVYNNAKHKYGRTSVKGSLGFTNFRRPVRHTVADHYYDFDLVNCQPACLLYLLEKNQATVPGVLRAYVNDRDGIISMHMEAWSIKQEDKWLVKQLFIRLFFMGGYDKYREDMREYNYNLPVHPTGFVTSLQRALLDVAQVLRQQNPTLFKIAQNKRKEANNGGGENGSLKTFMALYLQTVERNIVEFVMESVCGGTDLMRRKEYPGFLYTSYEYDGFKLLRENVDAYPGGKEEVCRLLELITMESGMPLKWKVKEMDEGYDLSEVDVPDASMKELISEMKVCSVSHRQFAEVVKTRYSDSKYLFEVRSKQWYTYDTNRDAWEASDFFLLRDMSKIVDSLFNYPAFIKEEKYKNAYESFLAKSGSSSWMSGVQKMSQTVMYCDKIDFDVETDIINFDNGVYEIDTANFRKRTMKDYVTLSTGYDYCEPSKEDEKYKEEVMEVLKQIHPTPEDLELNLMIMASGLSGRQIEKFFVFNGCGRNGKSLLNSAMKIILGDYYATANTSILTEDLRKKCSGDANSALAALDKTRYAVFREPPKNLPIQNSTVKDITGGGEIVSRQLFQKQKAQRLDMTVVLETNSKPPFAEQTGEAESERVIDYHFQSHFTSDETKLAKARETNAHVYPLRTELKEKKWWELRRTAFLHILLESLKVLHKADYNISIFVPEHVKVRSKNYCESSVLVVRLFHELFYVPDEGTEEPYSGWNRDITIANAVQYIRSSDNFSSLPGGIRYSRENQPTAMKQNLELHVEERLEVLYESHKQKFIRGFRKKFEPIGDLESTSEFDMHSESDVTDVL